VEIELYPQVEIHSGTFNIVVAPEEIIVRALEKIIGSRRFLILYIAGNYSRILGRINPRIAEFDIRRAFTAFQLLSILEEAHHTFVFVEHDPTLYEDFEEPLEYISMALKDLASSSTAILYSPGFDPFLRALSKRADRIFYLDEKLNDRSIDDTIFAPANRHRRSYQSISTDGQTTLEGF